MYKTLSLLAIVALTGRVSAWWDDGHIMTARIAYDILKESNPSVLSKAQNVLNVLTQSNPSNLDTEGKYPFVECATYGDVIKAHGGGW